MSKSGPKHTFTCIYAQCSTSRAPTSENWCTKCQSLDHSSVNCPTYCPRKRQMGCNETEICGLWPTVYVRYQFSKLFIPNLLTKTMSYQRAQQTSRYTVTHTAYIYMYVHVNVYRDCKFYISLFKHNLH